MIEYPDDEATEAESEKHGIPEEVLIRDLVRVVEVLNLKAKGFFGSQRVLAGSMALRCFNSPRFTVYDADFATAVGAQPGRKELEELLRYSDDDLEIIPASPTPHDARGTAWESEPIAYVPAFTSLAPEGSREFKADIASRGLVLPGIEREFRLPYDLGIWDEAPDLWIMDPHEVVAEKTLGWVVNRQAKHYADLGFIALGTTVSPKPLFVLDGNVLRETLAAKLEIMRGIQPDRYAAWPAIDHVVGTLEEDPVFGRGDWAQIVYVRARRDRFKPELLRSAVQRILVPMLKSSD
jgi:hypothetical protein